VTPRLRLDVAVKKLLSMQGLESQSSNPQRVILLTEVPQIMYIGSQQKLLSVE